MINRDSIGDGGEGSLMLSRPSVALLQSQAVQILREAILDGRLAQGSKLNEKGIAAELGISRGPIREALRALEEDGLVTSSPYRGARVATISARDLADVLEVRMLVEPHVSAQAVRGDSASLLNALRGHMADMQQAAELEDAPAVARAHTSFHAAFYERCPNRLMSRMWQRMEASVRLYLRAEQSVVESLAQIARDHGEILRLIEADDHRALRREVLRHVKLQHPGIMDLVDKGLDERRASKVSRQGRR